jgi:hypothetical protein
MSILTFLSQVDRAWQITVHIPLFHFSIVTETPILRGAQGHSGKMLAFSAPSYRQVWPSD